MPKVERESLQAWYRTAMRRRWAELEALRAGVARGDPDAGAEARMAGHALRGSGGTFGFPALSEAGTILEDAPQESLARVLEGVLQVLRRVAWPDAPASACACPWLGAAAGVSPSAAATPEDAWESAARALGVSQDDLAERIARHFGLAGPEALRPTSGALRLVPEALLAERHVLPLDEDGRTVRVATADPVDLLTEAEIRRVSGRTPAFVVVPPARLRAALDETLGRARKGRRAEVPSEPFGPPSPPECPILIVDDDPTARLVARAVLERKGYPVLEAPGGAEALALFGLNPGIGLAVVDLEMPLMDGHELVRRLRAAPGGAALAIVVLTGTQDPSVEAALIEEGADDYLEKPLDPRLFLARVSATLRRTAAGSG